MGAADGSAVVAHGPREALLLLALALLLLSGLRLLQDAVGDGELSQLLPSLTFLALMGPAYWAAQRRGVDPFRAHGVWVPLRGVGVALGVTAGCLAAFLLGTFLLAHAYGVPAVHPPWARAGTRLLTDAVFVALPEEWLFRGVLQPALDAPGGPTRRVLGAPLGRGALLSALLFGASHALLQLSPARLLTAVPGLLFAWLRARTGGVLPAALAHAASNAALELALGTWPGLPLPGAG